MASAIDMPFRHYTTVWRPRRTYVIYKGSTALTETYTVCCGNTHAKPIEHMPNSV